MGKENDNKTAEEILEDANEELEEKKEDKKEEKTEIIIKENKRSIGSIIFNIVISALILFIIFETVMGILDMQRLNDDKEPYWYIDQKVEKKDNKTETRYNIELKPQKRQK